VVELSTTSEITCRSCIKTLARYPQLFNLAARRQPSK